MSIPHIFDRRARRLAWARAARADEGDSWLLARAADDMVERLAAIRRPFASVLIASPRPHLVAPALPEAATIITSRQIAFDEDRLPFADAAFDLILSLGGLDSIDDLPGALVLMRRALRPDGVLLAALAGAGSLPALRTAMAAADPARAHFHPQIDIRAMGDLMLRAGFAQPVIDADETIARYGDLDALVRDLRANALSNCLAGRVALNRDQIAALRSAFARQAENGKTNEAFVTLHVTGWSTAAR